MLKERILVAGGAGFLGSHLCDRLLESGKEVYCLDNLHTGHKRNIAHLVNRDHFTFINHDIIEPITLEVDKIFNLACPASPIHYQEDPLKTVKTNVLGAINLLSLADRLNARILQASTSEVYGNPSVHPQPESYWGHVNPIGIRSCYDEGKRCAETLFFDYHRQRALEIRVVRIFNTYGPRMHPNDGRVVSNFIVQALKGDPITVYGDGSHTRSFCYVDDLLTGMIAMMDQDEVIGPINIGNPEEFTILELAEQIIRLTKSKSRIIHKSLPSDDPVQRKPNIDMAQQILKWQPRVGVEAGLMKTIAYFQALLTTA